jgi:hypothetical protein
VKSTRPLLLFAVVAGAGALATPAGALAAPADCPTAAVQVIETAPPGPAHKLALASLELTLSDPKGKVVASTKPGPKQWMGPKPAQESFVEHHWALPCLPPASYALEAKFKFRGDRTARTQRLEVGLGRGEIDVRLHLGFTARGREGKPHLQLLTLTRLLPAVGARLRPQWTPHPDGEARYILENVGPKPLHGVASKGNFVGAVERWDPATRTFAEVTRGAIIPPGDPGRAIPAKGTGFVREPEIQGRPRRLEPGRYRFVVEYQMGPVETMLTEAEKRGATIVRLHERHRAIAEFEIR